MPTSLTEIQSQIADTGMLQHQPSHKKHKSTHDAHENTWKCGELKLYFAPSAGG